MSNREILSTITNFNSRITTVETGVTDQSAAVLALQTDTGNNNGITQLVRTDGSGKIISQVLPSYIDDVLEFPSFGNFPALGVNGKIYVALDEPLKSWRWSGSTYIDVSGGIATVFGRPGPAITAQSNDYMAAQITNNGLMPVPDVQSALDSLEINKADVSAIIPAPVDSVHGRTGTVLGQLGDYSASQIVNVGLVPTGDVQTALDNLQINKADVSAIIPAPVDSVHGRTGTVLGQLADYSNNQITNIPAGVVTANDGQGAIDQLEVLKANLTGAAFTGSISSTHNVQFETLNGNAKWPADVGPTAIGATGSYITESFLPVLFTLTDTLIITNQTYILPAAVTPYNIYSVGISNETDGEWGEVKFFLDYTLPSLTVTLTLKKGAGGQKNIKFYLITK